MKSYSLVLQSILILLTVNYSYGRILDTESKNDKVADIYSTVELSCDLTGSNLNWRKIKGVRTFNLIIILE
jgi:hypothetical protein